MGATTQLSEGATTSPTNPGEESSTSLDEAPTSATNVRSSIFTPLAVAGLSSLGAGGIHASAIRAHTEHSEAVIAFGLLAVFQLAWGIGAMVKGHARSWFLVVGAAGSGAAVVGWLLAKTSGIEFISGMEEAEAIQLADGTAALLAVVAGLIVVRELLVPVPQVATSRHSLLPVAVYPIAVLSVASMIAAGSHSHPGGHDHDEGQGADLAHDHGTETAATAATAATVPVVPFVAADPIDLSGVPGVSAQEQAEAEDLLRQTLDKLPQFADVTALNDKGFYSIGDGFTGGVEHYINWDNVNDDRLLDPDAPESLVIRHDGDKQRLVAAMYMLPEGSTFDDAPETGGDLVQWHVHNDLCLTDDPIAPRLAGMTSADAECEPPNSKRGNVPMIHVWIEDHPCGPFAALEGIGGGQVAEGEEVVCTEEHAHATAG